MVDGPGRVSTESRASDGKQIRGLRERGSRKSQKGEGGKQETVFYSSKEKWEFHKEEVNNRSGQVRQV